MVHTFRRHGQVLNDLNVQVKSCCWAGMQSHCPGQRQRSRELFPHLGPHPRDRHSSTSPAADVVHSQRYAKVYELPGVKCDLAKVCWPSSSPNFHFLLAEQLGLCGDIVGQWTCIYIYINMHNIYIYVIYICYIYICYIYVIYIYVIYIYVIYICYIYIYVIYIYVIYIYVIYIYTYT